MRPFLQERTLSITPLSPVHVGSGEEIDPTSYVLEDGFLYGFEPVDGALGEKQKEELSRLAQRGDLLAIQRFFKQHAKQFIPFAELIAPVCPGFTVEYEEKLGKVSRSTEDGNQIFNSFFVKKHIATGIEHQSYIPGSAFKGASRTAWLDELLSAESRNFRLKGHHSIYERLDAQIMGDFGKSPMRLLKFSDFMPSDALLTEILYSVVWYKQKVTDRSQNSGITERYECLSPGQYRGLTGTVTLPAISDEILNRNRGEGLKVPNPRFLDSEGAFDFERLAASCNRFFGRRLLEDLRYLKSTEGQGDPDWCQSMEALLDSKSSLYKKLQKNEAFILRVGAHVGYDSVTYDDSILASVWLEKYDRKKRRTHEVKNQPKDPRTKTLAASSSAAQQGFLPFGWVVVEIEPDGDCESLKRWCDGMQVAGQSIQSLQQRIKDYRNTLRQQRTTLVQSVKEAEQAAKQAKERAQEKARLEAEAEAERLARLTENELKIDALKKACLEWVAQLPPHGNYRKQEPNPGQEGLYQDARRLVQEALKEGESWTAEERVLLAETIEEWLPKAVGPWNARSERRRLKLNALRGK